MNYVKKFRILPYSIFFHGFLIIILVSQSCANESSNQTTDTFNIIPYQKVLFTPDFGNNKKYSINDCIPVAFGDFNADKTIDVFCRNTIGNSIRVIFNNHPSSASSNQYTVNISGRIQDALATDFNGDAKLDLFVLYKDESDQVGYRGAVFWGNRTAFSEMQSLDLLFESSPTTLDGNGDSFVQLLGMVSVNNSTFRPACVFLKDHSQSYVQFLNGLENFRPDATQGSADLNGDYNTDLFLTLNTRNGTKFAVYNLPITALNLIREYGPPPGAVVLLLSLFSDIDGDGTLEHIQPVCMDFNCLESQLYIYDNNVWYQVPIPFGDTLHFPSKDLFPPPFDHITPSLKMADYNLDGYPDMVAIMFQTSTNTTVPILLLNQPCLPSMGIDCTYNRTFIPQIQEKSVLAATNATLAAFLDVLENGFCDLLVVQAANNQTYKLTGFYNTMVQDVHFLKVMVLSSFLCTTCGAKYRLPYGSNQPGQVISIETQSIMASLNPTVFQLASVQMAHAGQFSLEMPYVIIGLSSSPNFVEKVTVGIPPNSASNQLYHTFTQMIPNSQIVVVPIPILKPSQWHTALFLTPSQMILNTGIALAVTLFLLIVIIAVLHYREKLEDDRERKLQSQKFHYDAL